MVSRGRIDVVAGSSVLITGAAGGMGARYARRAARAGARTIALWDRVDACSGLERELTGLGAHVRSFAVDLADPDQITAALARTRAELAMPDILINNAGIVTGAPFWEHDAVEVSATMQVNALAPMLLTREVLNEMIADTSRPKRILNIASAAGTLANPRMSVYAASKWALIGWSESLRLELERAGHHHVAVTTFCPSYVATGMFDGARGPLWTPIMTPQRAVDAAWRGMLSATPVVYRPWTVKLAMALRGVLPTRAWDLLADRVFGVYSSMDSFRGRQPPVV